MKKCKICATLLAVVFVLRSFPVLALSSSADSIHSYAELSAAILAGTKEITLTGDVDMEGKATLGTLTDGSVIDGNGFTVYNLCNSDSTGFGLFNVQTGAHVTIKNLKIGPVTATLGTTNEDFTAGVLIGDAGTCSFTIDNVHVYAILSVDANNSASMPVMGGLIGSVNIDADSVIKNCTVNGSVTNVANVENASGTSVQPRTGGFIASLTNHAGTEKLQIINCTNYATISSAINASGFVSMINCGTANLEFINCRNNADISGKWGAAGFTYYNKGTVKLTQCINTGNVKTEDTKSTDLGIGGLVGAALAGTVELNCCVNSATVSANTGNTTKQPIGAGGLIGLVTEASVTVTKCVNLGNVYLYSNNAKAYVGGLIGALYGTGNATKTATITDSIVVADIYHGMTDDSTAGRTTEGWADFGIGVVTKGAQKGGVTPTVATVSDFSLQYFGAITGLGKTGSLSAGEGTAVGAEKTGIALDSKEAAVGALNALAIVNFSLNGETVEVNANVPQLVGVQKNAGKDAFRFVAVLKNTDLTQYKNVGFQISAKLNGKKVFTDLVLNSTKVMTALKATIGEADDKTEMSTKTYTATDLGGAYIVALSITGVPNTGIVVFSVTPYVNSTQYGTGWELTYTNGELTNAKIESFDGVNT